MKTDYHVHSISSGHAYNTILEIAAFAKNKGLVAIAITDHGPSMEGASTPGFFEGLNRINETIDGVEILKSCEANVISEDGKIDLNGTLQNQLDFVMAGLHERTPYPGNLSREKNTNSLVNAIRNNRINVISHPYRPNFPIEVDRLAVACAKNNVVLEINLSTLKLYKTNSNFIEEIQNLIDCVQKYGGKMTISSDAHFVSEIGDDSVLKDLRLVIPDDILFETPEQFKKFIRS